VCRLSSRRGSADSRSGNARSGGRGAEHHVIVAEFARILDALEAGQDEAIADDVSGQVKAALPAITTGILPGSTAADVAASA
jgi:hypothetical protein